MRRDPAAIWRAAPGYLVLGRPDRPPITVSGPGADVWLLTDALDRRSIVDVLAARYDADREVVRADVDALLDRLVDDGFVLDDTVSAIDG